MIEFLIIGATILGGFIGFNIGKDIGFNKGYEQGRLDERDLVSVINQAKVNKE